MRLLIPILMILALTLAIYNLVQVDFEDPFSDESIVAVITFIAALCAFLVLAILRTAKKIEKKVKKNS